MAEIIFRLRVETRDAKGKLSELQGKGEDVETQLEKPTTLKVNVSTALSGLRDIMIVYQGVMRVIGQVKQAISEHIEASNVQEDAEKSLAAALRATGEYSDEAMAKLKDYASGIQEVTRYGDEAIISGTSLAQNIGKFGSDILPDVQKAAVGLAATYKIDLQAAFQLIGRAGAGQTEMLTRYGIILDKTGSKEEQFAELLKIGSENFQIAKDEAESGSGALEQYSNIVGDAQEKIGDFIKLALVPLTKTLTPLVNIVGNFFRSLTETPLEATIRELEELGAAAEDIIELKKFMWKNQLEDINAELKKAGINYENIKDVTASLADLEKANLSIVKDKAKLLGDEKITQEELKEILDEIGFKQEYATMEAKRLFEEFEKGGELSKGLAKYIVGFANARLKINEKEKEELLEYSDLLIERETLENKINQVIDERGKKPKVETEALEQYKIKAIEIKEDEKDEILELEEELSEEMDEIIQARIDNIIQREIERQTKLNTLRRNFNYKQFDQTHSYYESQIEAIERYYRIRHDAMIEAGITEEEIAEQKAAAIQKVDERQYERQIRAGSKLYSDLAKLAKAGGKKWFAAYKTLAVVQATMDGISAAISAWKMGMQMGGLPLAILMTAASVAVTGVQIKEIIGMKYAGGGFTGYAPSGTEADETGERPVGIVHEEELIFQKPLVQKFGGFLSKLRLWMMGESPAPMFALAGGGFGEIVPEMPSTMEYSLGSHDDDSVLDKLDTIADAIKDNQVNLLIEDKSDLVGLYRYILKAKGEYERRGL